MKSYVYYFSLCWDVLWQKWEKNKHSIFTEYLIRDLFQHFYFIFAQKIWVIKIFHLLQRIWSLANIWKWEVPTGYCPCDLVGRKLSTVPMTRFRVSPWIFFLAIGSLFAIQNIYATKILLNYSEIFKSYTYIFVCVWGGEV